MEALRGWKPHLIYVQGGNTFWLHHCMEKGDWADALIEACCSSPENTDDERQSKAVYIGTSAGAILAGSSMQPACWKVSSSDKYFSNQHYREQLSFLSCLTKSLLCFHRQGWDDPSVVIDMKSYDDWVDVKGLGLTGSLSIFPHMEVQWQKLVDDRVQALPHKMDEQSPILACLRDEEVCYVEGRKQSIRSTGIVRSGEAVAML